MAAHRRRWRPCGRWLTEALPNSDHLWDGEIDGTLSVYIGDGVLGAAVQVLD